VVSSNTVKITVNATLTSGTIGASQTICYSTVPSALTQTVAATGGSGSYTYQWQSSPDGSAWLNIRDATTIGYAPPALTADTWYRRSVSDGICVTVSSNSVKITVYPTLTAGTIGNDQTISYGATPNALTEIMAASGGSGSYTYQWQSSSDGLNWSDITGATSTVYAPSSMFTNTWFKRFVIDGICGSSASNLVNIYVSLITLYTTEEPSSYGSDNRYSLGSEFEVLNYGFITKFRLYCNVNEGGLHKIRLWRRNGDMTFSQVINSIDWDFTSGVEGWREYNLTSAIPVQSGVYIISITNGLNNNYYSQIGTNPSLTNPYIRYLSGRYTTNVDEVPLTQYGNSGYFRDIVFNLFSPGKAGSPQLVCYNAVPLPLTQTEAPTGGNGVYNYQWQSSFNNSTWTNIDGATSSGYSPPALIASTYYRREVTSSNIKDYSPTVLVTVNPAFNEAVLHDNITIYNNTATNINVEIAGGTQPYTVNYSRNGVAQLPVTEYYSRADISTGVFIAEGDYQYVLTSVIDANGCNVQSLGNGITVTVSGTYLPSATNKALVIINSASPNYSDYAIYIKPYLDNFGIPYDEFNSPSSGGHPDFLNYGVIILGHRNIYVTGYPIIDLENAVSAGVGLCSFDPHLFDFQSNFATSPETLQENSSNLIDIVTDPVHYITQEHIVDTYSPANNTLTLLGSMTTDLSSYELNSSTKLATISGSPILQVSSHGNGRIVKWNGYNWMFDIILGPVAGMDDLIWRGIVWAARKPFVMQGLPPMVTMRVDDVNGTGGGVSEDFEWIKISNEFDFVPWCGTFNDNIPSTYLETLRTLINHNLTTASPHAFNDLNPIYFNHFDDVSFDAAANVIRAWNFYTTNNLKISSFILPHYYEISGAALDQIIALNGQYNLGIEFIGTHMMFGNSYYTSWLNRRPYRIGRDGAAYSNRPVYYADYVGWGGFDFFNCVTEIRDDGDYEWYPSEQNIPSTIARGVRHLRRALNSMVLPTLFTHDYYLTMSSDSWRTILGSVTSAISTYSPEYKSMDYAVKYVRAKSNIRVTNISETGTLVNITYSGANDLDTKCYLFTESGNQISHRLILLDKIIGGAITKSISK
jgi:hypothetical protein